MTDKAPTDWAEAHWNPPTGEGTELTQFNIWHHRRFGFVGHRDAVCGDRFLVWQASRESLAIELPPAPPAPEEPEDAIDDSHMDGYNAAVRMRSACEKSIKAAGLKVKS